MSERAKAGAAAKSGAMMAAAKPAARKRRFAFGKIENEPADKGREHESADEGRAVWTV